MNALKKLPVGLQSFPELIEEGYIYVDKPRLIFRMITSRKAVFLSRLRRFGKSLLGSTRDFFRDVGSCLRTSAKARWSLTSL
ncbi:MAG: AAA family ATPase [Candidatus Electrothrix scaldis]|nr:MAG: AAA family ATPase [Candidatus Electrothrix sp. GW3-3]